MRVPGLLVSDKKIFKVLSIRVYVKYDLSAKKIKVNLRLSFFKLYWAHVPNAAYQAPWPLGPLLPGKKIFKGFLPYIGVAAILVM